MVSYQYESIIRFICLFDYDVTKMKFLEELTKATTLVSLIHVLSWIRVLGWKMVENNKRPVLNKCPGGKITEILKSVLGQKIKNNHIFFYFSMWNRKVYPLISGKKHYMVSYPLIWGK